ncbi:response regulator [Bacillus pseudomycoides]|nr:hypothetical protein bmyco0002_47700 [Bacillus pseudomycoides]EEM08244.1 hypothetical protein bmyco0003_50690 [Bacillus pseudomycoides]PEJ20049.1 response regulator [Bacillus pseudomycoides]PEK40085.1 response regulator [Bacillus pseudomycoides]PEP60356.1 response regulator [Bacillus pseudomycoides]
MKAYKRTYCIIDEKKRGLQMKKRILIVEDEENIREVCERYLEREEYEVYTAVNGTEGWDLFLTYQPDLII